MSSHFPLDAEALYAELLRGVRGLWRPDMALMGIWTGGAWLAERLHADLGLTGHPGVISSTLHRDDFGARGLGHGTDATKIPYAVDGTHLLLVDDVLHTGRTIRAVLNELYDFGRPASVTLAVLVERSGRELPIRADLAAAQVDLPSSQRLSLLRTDDGRFQFNLREAS